MNIGKKAAFLTAAAGALVIVGAGASSAHTYGGVYQGNECDTASGAITTGAVAGPSGDLNVGGNCINFTNTGGAYSAYQGNDCDTATGPISTAAATAPTGDISVGATCSNIALSNTP